MGDIVIRELDAEALYRRCDHARFDFETTAELEELEEVVGQPRAVAAVQFGLGISREGYNVFALGPEGIGKYFLARRFAEKEASGRPVPPDWAYVANFEQSNKPRLLRLPPGVGAKLRGDVEHLVERLGPALSGAFQSDEYQSRRQVIEEEFREQSGSAFEELRQKARERGLALLRTPMGLAFAPMHDDQVLSPEEVQKLSLEERERLESEVASLQQELQRIVR